jgi:hypothetical protein
LFLSDRISIEFYGKRLFIIIFFGGSLLSISRPTDATCTTKGIPGSLGCDTSSSAWETSDNHALSIASTPSEGIECDQHQVSCPESPLRYWRIFQDVYQH